MEIDQLPYSGVAEPVASNEERFKRLLDDPIAVRREINRRSLFRFLEWAWPELSAHEFVPNWHIVKICGLLQEVAYRVVNKQPHQDLLINIPPGSTKTITCSIVFPVWCWTQWYWLRFITASYTRELALESAEYSRDFIRSDLFQQYYPELGIKDDKDVKSNFKVVKKVFDHPGREPRVLKGGNRFSTSVGGTLMGFHGDILIWDDPLNTQKAVSEKERETANRWIDQTLPSRKTNKKVSTIIGIMQRLHQDDPSGHVLAKKKHNVTHICLPGEIRNYKKYLRPQEWAEYYVDDLMDVNRMGWEELTDMEIDFGQYGYAGQVGQNPTPPGGGMFKVAHFQIIDQISNPVNIEDVVRYWDKAATAEDGAYTVGVKLAKLKHGKWLVMDVKRGQWATEERERIIRETAEADGRDVTVIMEQEPGSGGKESVENTIKNLAGFVAKADRPSGDKVFRADPFSVQVNMGNVYILRAPWNHSFIEEFRFFPFGTYKDQVDGSSAGFNYLAQNRIARRIT